MLVTRDLPGDALVIFMKGNFSVKLRQFAFRYFQAASLQILICYVVRSSGAKQEFFMNFSLAFPDQSGKFPDMPGKATQISGN